MTPLGSRKIVGLPLPLALLDRGARLFYYVNRLIIRVMKLKGESMNAFNNENYQIISGLFSSPAQMDALLVDLERQGLGSEMTNVLMSNQTRDQYLDFSKTNKSPEGASIGGISGGAIGAILGGLTMAGTLLVPGLNLLVAGPIIGTIAGGAVGVATGGLVGALVGVGVPEYEAKAYEKQLEQAGNAVVLAHVPKEDAHKIKDLFKHHGAHNIIIQKEKQTV
jgi:hypothetical protein